MSDTENSPATIENKTPTRAEIKAAIKDPTVPAVIRRHLSEQLYGEGGGGRKANQQRFLMKQIQSIKKGQHRTEGLKKPEGMSGRQFKKARKLIRQGRKAIFGAQSQT